MILWDVRFDDDDFRRAMRDFGGRLAGAVRTAINRYLLNFRGRVSRERLRGAPGLARRTGILAASQKVVVVGNTLETIDGMYTIGGGLVAYARIHEEGGIVRPVRAKFLAIPLPAAKTAAGVGRVVSPRDFKDTFVRKGIIWQRIATVKGKRPPKGASTNLADRATIVPLFVLKKQVRIEPRLGVVAMFKADESNRTAHMSQAVRAAAKAVGLKAE